MNYTTDFKSLRGAVTPAEWQTRVDLAACYRLMDAYGMTDLIYNHITARIPGTEHLLINLYGLLYKEITASSLVKIDVEGFEGEAIAGGREVLSAHMPVVFLELHGAYLRRRGRDPAAVLGQLNDLGYRRFLSGERPMAPAEAAGHELIRLVCLP